MNFLTDIKKFGAEYYLFNILNIIERCAWFILIIQMPIYLAQKDITGGLAISQELKGYIYLYWAFLQNFIPIFAGNYADRIKNRKLSFFLAFLTLLVAFYTIAFLQSILGVLIGVTLVSFGVGYFKPALQGIISANLKGKNSSLGWGLFFWMYNFFVFVFATPYAKYLREISWEWVFAGAGSLFLINMLLSFLISNNKPKNELKLTLSEILKDSYQSIKVNHNLIFLVSMAGFSMIYMQFYETLPNFIYDWVNTSHIVESIGLGSNFTMNTWAGKGISFEWLYNINTGLTLLLLIPSSIFLTGKSNVKSVIGGVVLITLGFSLSIWLQNGLFLIIGFIIYTIGELITNPKYTEHFSLISPFKKESGYMGFLFLPNLIGYCTGAVLGGYLYGEFGEKESLARKFLAEKNIINFEGSALSRMMTELSITKSECTNILWEYYNPYLSMVPFAIIGLFAVGGLLYYKKKISDINTRI